MGGRSRERRAGESPVPARALIAALRREMTAAADPARAKAMQAYMKSTMPYYGIYSPVQGAIHRKVFAEFLPLDCERWQATIVELWRSARYREERYGALSLLSAKQQKDCLEPSLMPLLEEMVTTGAWWDLVDSTTHVVGDLLRLYPKQIKPVMRAWSTDANLWKRRVSIICQLGFKKDTDLALLYANIEPNLADREFFIRKAIGWALRQYAWTDPEEIARYVREHSAQLSGLSRREALKNIGNAG